jgi:hypothetical protein
MSVDLGTMTPDDEADAEAFWDSIKGLIRRAYGLHMPSPEEAEAELDAIKAEPLTEDQFERMMSKVRKMIRENEGRP